MSLDVYLYEIKRCPHCDKQIDENDEEYVYRGNITHNLNKMAMALECYEILWRPDEHDIKYAKEIIETLEDRLKELKNNPDKYKLHNPKNGWGSYEGLINFISEYLIACKRYPEARIEVSR